MGSIEKVDRTTVVELAQIAEAYNEVQSILDTANRGLNPLGVATNVVPFGLNPSAIEDGKTHFDQIFERAAKALFNAVKLFEFANDNTQRLRSVQDAAESFDELVDQNEAAFNARLIEIFGRPYPEDIGVGGFYPAGYRGPDWIHFDYVEPSKLLGGNGVDLDGNTVTITVDLPWTTIDWNVETDTSGLFENTVAFTCAELSGVTATESGGVCTGTVSADFNISTDGLGLVKPPGWSQRIEPGRIQLARSETLQALGQYERAIAQYEAHLTAIEVQVGTVEQAIQITGDQLNVINTTNNEIISYNNLILGFQATAASLRQVASLTRNVAACINDGLEFILIIGLANGTDAPNQIAGATFLCTAEAIATGLEVTAIGFEMGALSKEQAIEEANNAANLSIATLEGEFLVSNEIGNLVNLLAETPALQLEAYILQEAINAAVGNYRSALGQGMRIFNEREAVRQRAARQVSEYRYQDMAFRIFRNDALQKYRATFDLAARYAFLAAKAYDYETALLGADTASGEQFLTEITKERVLGQIEVLGPSPIPQPGPGLAGKLAALSNNFEVLRTELGFNDNAAELERTFSLRWENYRIANTAPFDADWRQVLNNAIVADITQVPEYGLFALPFAFEGEIPGIVLRFQTDITTGNNFFGWPSTADELYPTTYFAIKLHKVALRFTGYPGAPLNNQVECYLIPTGSDVMRVPSCTFPRVRYWQLLDQTMPVPFTLSEAQFSEPLWMPWDGVIGGAQGFIQRRLYPTVSARPIEDGDELDQSFILTGRSAWNTDWTLIIPGIALEGLDQDEGIDVFINGADGNGGVEDINLLFTSYGYFGCSPGRSIEDDGDEDQEDVED